MGRRKTSRAPAPGPRGHLRSALRASDIEFLIAIEGRAMAAAIRDVARRFCISQGAVRSWIHRLKRREVLRTVVLVDRARCGAVIESIAHIRVDLSHPAAADLEAVLRDDPAVTEAAMTFGPSDYTAFAIHGDQVEAAAWSRGLQSLPYVAWCRVERMRTQFKRFASAAILLKPAAHDDLLRRSPERTDSIAG